MSEHTYSGIEKCKLNTISDNVYIYKYIIRMYRIKCDWFEVEAAGSYHLQKSITTLRFRHFIRSHYLSREWIRYNWSYIHGERNKGSSSEKKDERNSDYRTTRHVWCGVHKTLRKIKLTCVLCHSSSDPPFKCVSPATIRSSNPPCKILTDHAWNMHLNTKIKLKYDPKLLKISTRLAWSGK